MIPITELTPSPDPDYLESDQHIQHKSFALFTVPE